MLNLEADSMFYAVLNSDSLGWILSNHLDFSNCNFITKLLNPGSSKLPIITSFLMRELWLKTNCHWNNFLIQILYNQKQPNKAQPKILSCDEIMLSDEITVLVASM